MNVYRPACGWRASALAAALFAITFNFLQPLVHAALLRDGAPSTLWTVLCNSTAAAPDGKPGGTPMAAHDHECCLGLAHTPAAIAPSATFTALPPTTVAVAPSLPIEQPTPVGIRDGPSRPRGPPV